MDKICRFELATDKVIGKTMIKNHQEIDKSKTPILKEIKDIRYKYEVIGYYIKKIDMHTAIKVDMLTDELYEEYVQFYHKSVEQCVIAIDLLKNKTIKAYIVKKMGE